MGYLYVRSAQNLFPERFGTDPVLNGLVRRLSNNVSVVFETLGFLSCIDFAEHYTFLYLKRIPGA
jgi:hypothetical protein